MLHLKTRDRRLRVHAFVLPIVAKNKPLTTTELLCNICVSCNPLSISPCVFVSGVRCWAAIGTMEGECFHRCGISCVTDYLLFSRKGTHKGRTHAQGIGTCSESICSVHAIAPLYMGVVAVDEIRPSVDDFNELEVSFADRKQSLWSVVGQFANDNATDALCAVGGLVVCGIACIWVADPWAACMIVALVLAFCVFVVVYGQEESGADESRNESASTQEARED
ncbi:hypothetical protein Pan14r_49700 [Crateriforma conspicua]|uniref:Transmembrane protein n=1 Tax=Crateriforma conspicua TaxID=2527996 RepID=A0A5C5YB88_9PLAN|nr:hypothetical protein Pan14r_49700 [Crateriforma conspicua]